MIHPFPLCANERFFWWTLSSALVCKLGLFGQSLLTLPRCGSARAYWFSPRGVGGCHLRQGSLRWSHLIDPPVRSGSEAVCVLDGNHGDPWRAPFLSLFLPLFSPHGFPVILPSSPHLSSRLDLDLHFMYVCCYCFLFLFFLLWGALI